MVLRIGGTITDINPTGPGGRPALYVWQAPGDRAWCIVAADSTPNRATRVCILSIPICFSHLKRSAVDLLAHTGYSKNSGRPLLTKLGRPAQEHDNPEGHVTLCREAGLREFNNA